MRGAHKAVVWAVVTRKRWEVAIQPTGMAKGGEVARVQGAKGGAGKRRG